MIVMGEPTLTDRERVAAGLATADIHHDGCGIYAGNDCTCDDLDDPLPSSVKPSDAELVRPDVEAWLRTAQVNNTAMHGRGEFPGEQDSRIADLCEYIIGIERLAAARLSVREGEWLPIETAPRDGKKVLLTWRTDSDNYRGVSVAFWAERDTAMDNAVGWFDYDWNMIADDTQALGWMPCPARPSRKPPHEHWREDGDGGIPNTSAQVAEWHLERVSDALRWVLPMAKGYAAAHDVGNNKELVTDAEQRLRLADENAPAAPSPASVDGSTPTPTGGQHGSQEAGHVAYQAVSAAAPDRFPPIDRPQAGAARSSTETGEQVASVDVGEAKTAAYETASRVTQAICDMDPADPDQPNTLCISVDDLHGIVEREVRSLSTALETEQAKVKGLEEERDELDAAMRGWFSIARDNNDRATTERAHVIALIDVIDRNEAGEEPNMLAVADAARPENRPLPPSRKEKE